MSGIFLSYRRDDASGWTGRLYEHLVREWGTDQVFMDIDAIAPGDDFREAITHTLSTCDVVLVVIGPNWISSRDQAGNRRLDDEGDTHRAEVAAALVADVRVVPVLVGGAAMPNVADLPNPLKDLAYRNAAVIDDRRFASDVAALLKVLGPFVADRTSTGAPHGDPDTTADVGDRHQRMAAQQDGPVGGREEDVNRTPPPTHAVDRDAAAPRMAAAFGMLLTLAGLWPRWHSELAVIRIGAVIFVVALAAVGLRTRQWRWTVAAGAGGLTFLTIWMLQLLGTHPTEVREIVLPGPDGIPNVVTFAGTLLVLATGVFGMRSHRVGQRRGTPTAR